MSEKNKIPEIRFKGFGGEWEERAFGDLASYKKGPFGSALKKDLFVPKTFESIKVYEQQNAIKKNFKLERYFITKTYANKLNAFEVHGGDIIVSCAGTIGEIYVLPSDAEYGIINQALMRVRVNEDITNKTLFKYLFSNMIDIFSKIHSNGSAMKNIPPFADLKPTSVYIPSKHEQRKVVSLLMSIDTLITLHQRKYDKLLNVKKAMLEKMFPKNGADVPEIRFKGFSKKWEERKLGEVSDYKNGKGHEDKQNTFGKYELINLNSISIDGGLKHSGKFIDETDTTLNENDLVMVLSDVAHGDLLGRVAFIPENNKFVLNQRVALLRPNNSVIPLFLFYNINAHQIYFKSQGAGMSQLNISKSSVEDFTSYIPNQDEQTKIGTFFKNLDTLLTLHQSKLEKLKNIKKACMEKMFV